MTNSMNFDKGYTVQHQTDAFFSILLQDASITEICINKPHEIFYEKNSKWYKLQESDFIGANDVLTKITYSSVIAYFVAIGKFVDQTINDMSPILSAVLPNGERVQCVMPSAVESGKMSFTMRRPSRQIKMIDDYRKDGFFDHIVPISNEITKDELYLIDLHASGDYENFLKKSIKFNKTIVVAGETGSGKTTFMKALMQEIPTEKRIITIEDVPELFLPNHPNHVNLFYPSEGLDNVVTASSLMKSSMRQKPDNLLVAELRGGEAFDFINICSSGHGGSITSCHAGNAQLTFERIAMMVMQNPNGRQIPYEIIKRLLYLTIDIIVHVHNDVYSNNLGRHITEIWYDPKMKRA